MYNSFVRLKTLSTQEYTQMRQNITINLYEILQKATEHIAPGMNLESIPNEDRMFIDFSHLENIDFAGMSIIEWFRMIIGAFMVYMTATYFWHSIIPPRVVE